MIKDIYQQIPINSLNQFAKYKKKLFNNFHKGKLDHNWKITNFLNLRL